LEDIREESNTRGKLIIIDFKLKSLPSRIECTGDEEHGLANFQLPLYLSLTEEIMKNEVNTALFFSIMEHKQEVIFGAVQNPKTKISIPGKEEDRILRNGGRYKRIMEEFNQKAVRFAEEIKNGCFSVFETKHEECNSCNYRRICRTVNKIDGVKMPIWKTINE
jgi:hypothetical protein